MNVPKLRFKEFNDEWSFTELAKISSDISYGMGLASKEYDGVNKYIRITDIDEKTNKYSNKDIVSPDGVLEDKYLVNKNDILFARTGASTGKTYLYDEKDGKLYFAGFLIRANIVNHDANFIFQQTKTNKYNKWVKIMSMRSGQPGINSQEYGSYKFSITSPEEEEKISKTLNLLDKKIELQTKKIEDLKLFKLCTAKIIFKDNSLLCKKQLKELCNIVKGKQINSEFLSEAGEYYMLNGGINPSGFINEYNTNENTISISEGGNSCGYVNFNKSKFWAGGHCYTITPIDINNIYLYQILKYNENKIMDLRVGSGLPNIQKKDLENFSINVHRSNMQNKIATILSSIDKLIDLEEKKINNIEKLKKGLMQNMFV